MSSPYPNLDTDPDIVLNNIFDFARGLIPKVEQPVDILENNKFIDIYMEIPGVSKNNLNIEVYSNKLKIIGKKICPYVIEEFRNKKIGINYSDIKQNITLPLAVTNESNITVKIIDGILWIRINKEEEKMNKFNVTIG